MKRSRSTRVWRIALVILALACLGTSCAQHQENVSESGEDTQPTGERATPQPEGGTSSPTATVPSYTVAKRQDVSTRDAKRLVFRVVVDKDMTEQAVLGVAKDLVQRTTATKKVNAIEIFFYYDPDTVGGAYTVARVDWAPEGDWAKAGEVTAGDYQRNQYRVEMGTAIGIKPTEPKETAGLSEGERKQIFRELVEAEDKADAQAEKKYPTNPGAAATAEEWQAARANVKRNAAESRRLILIYQTQVRKKYGITKQQQGEIQMEGLTKSWPPL